MAKRRRRFFLIAAVVVLVAGGTSVFRAKHWLRRDPLAAATAAYSRGEWDRATSLVHRRLKDVPDDVRAVRLAARAAARQDQDRKAMAIYNQLFVGDMELEDFFLMGRSLDRMGQSDPALKAYETALSSDPDYPEALDALSRLYLQNDRYNAVEQTAGRLARRPGWEARGLLMLGTARAEIGDAAGAAEALRRWLEVDPTGRTALPHPAASFRKILVRSLLKSRQPAAARQALGPLLDSSPDAEDWWLLSRCFLQEGARDRAAEVLGKHPSIRTGHPLEFEPAPFVGAARCAGCHRPQSEAVMASRHANTFSRARDLGKLPLPEGPLTDPGNDRVTHRFRREADGLVVETREGDRVLRAVIDYAFGALDHYTTFVAEDERHGSYMIRMSHFDSPRGAGWDLSTGLPPRPPDEDEYLGKKMLVRDGVRRCLYCHTTNLHAVLHEVGPEAADHAIGCERCHGPGGHHVAAVEAGFSDPAIASPGQASAAEINTLCSKCHGMHHAGAIDAPRTDPIWLRFQSITMAWSRCFTESGGELSCVTCHDPHRNRETSAVANEAKCLSCHSHPSSARPPGSGRPTRPDPGNRPLPAAKTACPVNPSQGCIGCHMPKTWREETHSFKTDHFIRIHMEK